MSDFAFRGYFERVMRSMVQVMLPRWPDYQPKIESIVFDQTEMLVRSYPRLLQVGMKLVLIFIDVLSGPLTLSGIRLWSRMSVEERTLRLQKLAHHRIRPLGNLVKFIKIIISLAAYSHPEVEAYLGVDRRGWRADRRAFRDQLLTIGERNPPRPVPQALGADPLYTPEEYLQFAYEREDRQGPNTEDDGAS